MRHIVAPARPSWRLPRLLMVILSVTVALVGPAFSEALGVTVVRVSASADAPGERSPAADPPANARDGQRGGHAECRLGEAPERMEDRRVGPPMASGHATLRTGEKQPGHLPVSGLALARPAPAPRPTTSLPERVPQDDVHGGYDSRAPPPAS